MRVEREAAWAEHSEIADFGTRRHVSLARPAAFAPLPSHRPASRVHALDGASLRLICHLAAPSSLSALPGSVRCLRRVSDPSLELASARRDRPRQPHLRTRALARTRSRSVPAAGQRRGRRDAVTGAFGARGRADGAMSTSNATATLAGIPLKWLSLVVLTVQNSMLTILLVYVRFRRDQGTTDRCSRGLARRPTQRPLLSSSTK